jgi:hypothetical protein
MSSTHATARGGKTANVARPALTVIEGGASPRVFALETATLARAVDDMAGRIASLPRSSEYHGSFMRARQTLVEELEARS